MRVGITAAGQAQNTIEKEPQTAPLICWDQTTADPCSEIAVVNVKGNIQSALIAALLKANPATPKS
jgi:hypothetical protein